MRSDRLRRRVFATIRFAGDDLDPPALTRILEHHPGFAHSRGESFRHGSRSPEQVGKTGVWFLSTDGRVAGDRLSAHTDYVARMLSTTPAEPLKDDRFLRLQRLVEDSVLSVSASCFWAGRPEEPAPAVPRAFTELIARLHGAVEIAFDYDWSASLEHADLA